VPIVVDLLGGLLEIARQVSNLLVLGERVLGQPFRLVVLALLASFGRPFQV